MRNSYVVRPTWNLNLYRVLRSFQWRFIAGWHSDCKAENEIFFLPCYLFSIFTEAEEHHFSQGRSKRKVVSGTPHNKSFPSLHLSISVIPSNADPIRQPLPELFGRSRILPTKCSMLLHHFWKMCNYKILRKLWFLLLGIKILRKHEIKNITNFIF